MSKAQSFLVTGASSFLGTAFANYLAKNTEGKVFLTSRSQHDFTKLVKNDNIAYLPNIDLNNELEIEKLKQEVDKFLEEEFNIINCVGYFHGYDSIEETSLIEAKKIFDSNVLSLYAIAHKFLPLMKQRKGGNFVAFSAHTVYQYYPQMVVFTAAKAAVEGLVKGIANEYSEFNIIANTFALATLLTEVEKKIKPKGDYKNWLLTEEVCETVVDIISHRNKLINGNIIHLFKHSHTFFHQSYFDRINNQST